MTLVLTLALHDLGLALDPESPECNSHNSWYFSILWKIRGHYFKSSVYERFLMLVTHIIIAFNHGIDSAIYKAGSLTVPSHSMILPGTIPDTLISCEWGASSWNGLWGSFLMGECLAGGFVNSTVTALFTKSPASWFTAVPLVCLV